MTGLPKALALSACCVALTGTVQAQELTAEQVEFFEKHIRPVLVERCFGCHSAEADDVEGGLRLDTRRNVLAGGRSGQVIVSGKPDESLLIQAIRREGPEMPPDGKLPDAVIARFVEWVRMGAPDPRSDTPGIARPEKVEIDFEAGREFWSFQPIRDPAVPHVRDLNWPRRSVDYFVLAKLEEQGLRPVGPATKRALIRRASFDLTGLPPTVEQVEAFVKDDSADAFEKVVDRLLASPHYGERWARRWMDLARYGEDQAHSFKPRLYPSGFRYRDWLIRAFNEDMAYDRFLVAQIAGDLLDEPGRAERLPALGFFALGPVYYGNTKLKVFDELDDRIDTFTRGLLGLTVACARCHDHKYDPIATEDYYALGGVFASSEYVEAPLVRKEVVEAYEQAQGAVEAAEKRVDDFLAAQGRRLSESNVGEIAKYLIAASRLEGQEKSSESIERVAKSGQVNRAYLERLGTYLAEKSKQPPPALARWFEVVQGHASAAGRVEPTVPQPVTQSAQAVQRYVESLVALRDAVDEFRSAKAALVSGRGDELSEPAALEPEQLELLEELFGEEGVFAVDRRRARRMLSDEAKTQLAELESEHQRLEQSAPPKYAIAHSWTDSESVRDLAVNIRGDPDSPGEVVPRRFLRVLTVDDPRPFTVGSGRLELARAVASPDNPLTARVIVNRVWQHLFGTGLVATPSNFGTLGQRPSHPDLLDHLARRLIDSGWSLKALQREILLSATYQLSSDHDERNNAKDAGNVYLWRANRRRLDVEAWRDAMLAVSGRLDRRVGGPSASLSELTNRRRTVYAQISRHDLDPLLRLFDLPDPNITSGERTVTTVPLQQLFALNSEFVIHQSKALAGRLTADDTVEDEPRIRRAFRMVYGRPANDVEVRAGLSFLAATGEQIAESGADERLGAWEQYAQVLLSSNEFLYVD